MKKLKKYKVKGYNAESHSLYRSESEIIDTNLMKIVKYIDLKPDKILYLLDVQNMKYLIFSDSV